jgi:hypothetical protein
MYHFAYDREGQPTGPACGAPATQKIIWPLERTFSYACDEHSSDEAFDEEAPERIVVALDEESEG